MRGRLVEDQEPRLLGERARDDRALTLAAAQIVERQVREIEHAGRLHRLAGRRPIARALEIAAGIGRIAGHQHELADGERKLRQGPLRHDGDPAAQVHAGQSPDRHALEADLAGAGLEHARQQSNHRRLARTVGPDHPDDLARRDVERKLLDRKRSRSPLRRRWIREAHSAELCQHHSASTLEARARGAAVTQSGIVMLAEITIITPRLEIDELSSASPFDLSWAWLLLIRGWRGSGWGGG